MSKLSAACVLVLTLSSGCDAMGGLALQAMGLDVPEATSSRVGMFPANGTMAWRGTFEVDVFLRDPADIERLTVQVDGESGSFTPDCYVDDMGLARCPIAAEVPEEEDFTITASIGTHELVSRVSSRTPEPGRAFRVSEGLTVLHAGASEGSTTIVQTLFEGNAMATVLADDPEGMLLLGPADYWEDGVMSLDRPGLTMPLPLNSLEDGLFETRSVEAFLPLSSPNGLVTVRLLDCSVAGFVDEEGLHFELDAVLTGESLSNLAAGMGLPGSAIYGIITPDVDLDGDGEDESVRLEISGDSPESPLRAWTEE